VPATDSALERLAALDSAAALRGPVLVAESGGALRAALSLGGTVPSRDPFAPTKP
jgi:hypothetical protein